MSIIQIYYDIAFVILVYRIVLAICVAHWLRFCNCNAPSAHQEAIGTTSTTLPSNYQQL